MRTKIKKQYLYKDKDWLYEQHVLLGKAAKDIVFDYPGNTTTGTIRKYLIKYGIFIRGGIRDRTYHNKEWTENQYITLNKSIKEISKELKIMEETLYKWLMKHNIPLKEEDLPKIKEKKIFPKKKIVNGYRFIYTPNHPKAIGANAYVAEHILIAEKKLGRFLGKYEPVHHIDGNKLNNNPENLHVSKNTSDHGIIHKNLRKISYKLIKMGIIKFDFKKNEYYIPPNLTLFIK